MMRFGTDVFGQRFLLEVLVLTLLTGCSGLMKGAPPLPAYKNAVIEKLIDKYSKAEEILPTQVTVDKRNTIIEELKYLIDVNYSQFENEFFVGRATFDTAADLAALALGGTGAVIRPAGVQAILAAVSAGLAGGRVSINKNFFHEKSSDALIAKMRAGRAERLRLIRGAQILNLSDYSMSRALADLGDYYYAGTVVGALQGIISEAGEKEKQATDAMDKELKDKIEVEYQKGPLHDRIRSWLAEGDLALRKRKQAAFIDWLKREKKVEGISPNAWINRASPAELLEALVEIERLNIR